MTCEESSPAILFGKSAESVVVLAWYAMHAGRKKTEVLLVDLTGLRYEIHMEGVYS